MEIAPARHAPACPDVFDMNTLTFQVLRLLADGEFRSGEDIARTLGVSRATVWNALHGVDGAGVELFKVRGRGYRLAAPLALLEQAAVEHHLGAHRSKFTIEVLEATASTNTLLVQRANLGAAAGSVIAAEWQTHGRGRRGRAWESGVGAALTFSLLWRFQQGAGFLAGLSLAIGVAVARALARAGVPAAGLKWPNDVMWDGRKLAGILIELHGEMQGPSAAVIGIGVNCELPARVRERIDQPVADLAEAGGAAADRNRVLALMLIELERVLASFAREGFEPLRDEWHRRHVDQGKMVRLVLPDGASLEGIAAGVAADGSLLLDTASGRRRFHSAEISLRSREGGRGRNAE